MFSYTIIFIAQLLMTSGMSIKEGKKQACKHDVLVTALLEDIGDMSYTYVFSHDLRFKITVTNFEIIEVKEVSEAYPEVEGPIESAMYSASNGQFFLGRRDLIMAINNTKPLFHHRDYNLQELKHVMNSETGMKEIKDFFNCGSMYKEAEKVGVYQDMRAEFADFSGKTMSCLLVITNDETERKKGRAGCTPTDGIPTPERVISADQLSGSTCEGMSAVKAVGEPYKWRFMLADKKTLRMWHDDELIKGMELTELFGCSSMFVVLIVIACVVGIILVGTVVGLTVYVVMRRSRRTDNMHETSVTDTRTFLTKASTPKAKQLKGAKI